METSWNCGICGSEHGEPPLDIAFAKPQHYFDIPEAEVGVRVLIDSDTCVIDGSVFLIRGVLNLPVRENDKDFGWGVWVVVHEENFRRYLALYDKDGFDEPAFRGFLSATMPPYPDTFMLPVAVQLRAASQRPVFKVIPKTHALYFEQRDGITLERAHEIVRVSLPWLFNQNGGVG